MTITSSSNSAGLRIVSWETRKDVGPCMIGDIQNDIGNILELPKEPEKLSSQKQSWKIHKDRYKKSLDSELERKKERLERFKNKLEVITNNNQREVIVRIISRIEGEVSKLEEQIDNLRVKRGHNKLSSQTLSWEIQKTVATTLEELSNMLGPNQVWETTTTKEEQFTFFLTGNVPIIRTEMNPGMRELSVYNGRWSDTIEENEFGNGANVPEHRLPFTLISEDLPKFASDDPGFDDYDTNDNDRKRNDFFLYDKDMPGGNDALDLQEIWNTDLMYLEDTQRDQKERDAFDWTGRENLQLGFGSLKFSWQIQPDFEINSDDFHNWHKNNPTATFAWVAYYGHARDSWHIIINRGKGGETISDDALSFEAASDKAKQLVIDENGVYGNGVYVISDHEKAYRGEQKRNASQKFSWQLQGPKKDMLVEVIKTIVPPGDTEGFMSVEVGTKAEVVGLLDKYNLVNLQLLPDYVGILVDRDTFFDYFKEIPKESSLKLSWQIQPDVDVLTPKAWNNHLGERIVFLSYLKADFFDRRWHVVTGLAGGNLVTMEHKLLYEVGIYKSAKDYAEKWLENYNSSNVSKQQGWYVISNSEEKYLERLGNRASLKFAWKIQEPRTITIAEDVAFSLVDYYEEQLYKLRGTFDNYIEEKKSFAPRYFLSFDVLSDEVLEIISKHLRAYERWAREMPDDKWKWFVNEVKNYAESKIIQLYTKFIQEDEQITSSSLKFSADTYFDSSPAESNPVEESKLVNPIDDKHLRRTNPKRFDQRQDWYQESDSDISNRYDNAIQGDASLKFS